MDTRPRGYKLEYSLKLKIKRNHWLIADTCRKQPIVALYFEFFFFRMNSSFIASRPDVRMDDVIIGIQ